MDFPEMSSHRNKWLPFEITYAEGKFRIVSYFEPIDQHLIRFNARTNNAFREILSDSRFRKTKMENLAAKLSEVMLILASIPVQEETDGKKVEAELKFSSNLIEQLRQLQPQIEREALNTFSESLGIPPDSVLDYLQMLVFMCVSERFVINKDFVRVNKYFMESIMYAVKHEFRSEIDIIFLLIDHAFTLLCGKNEKFLRQILYHLKVAKHLLQNCIQEDKLTEAYKKCTQFWFYVKAVYAGKLLEKYKKRSEQGSVELLEEKMETMELTEQLVTFDDFNLPDMVLDEEQLQSENDVKSFYIKLLKEKEEMEKWGALTVSCEETSYGVMNAVLNFAKQHFSTLENL